MGKSKLILHISNKPFKPLEKASNIELFFDLVLIFCMRNIIPVLTEAEDLTWYTYYTFAFTFLLMLQLWFHTTLIMNRYGTGDTIDRASLVLIMLLLFVMTHAISTGWENYLIYNMSWIGILAVLILHWFAKLRTLPDLTKNDYAIMRRTIIVLALQAAVVAVSSSLPSLPGQIGCAIAVLIGFASWGASKAHLAKPANFEHLTERCALLVILTFGETLISLGTMLSFSRDVVFGLFMFSLIVTLFFIFLNQYEVALDKDCKTNGIGYMAVSVWLVFVLANINAAMDLMNAGEPFFFDTDLYLAVSTAMFMFAILLYIPYSSTRSYVNKKWLTARIVFNSLIVVAPIISSAIPLLGNVAGVVSVFGVFFLDRSLCSKLVHNRVLDTEKA